MRTYLLITLTFLVLAQACTKTDDEPPITGVTPSAVLVLNEGLFRRGNASITGYDAVTSTTLGTVYDPSSTTAGGLDILQSATMLGDTLVLVANNSNSLVLLDAENLEEIERFEGLGSPRYLTQMPNGQFLVTDLYADRLLILNTDFTVALVLDHEGHAEGSIAFQEGALFTSPSRKSLYYFDAILGQLTDSINLSFSPNGLLQLDANRIAVCGGAQVQGESGVFAIIDWDRKSEESLISLSESESSLYPRLAMSETHLYCLQRDLLSVPLVDPSGSNLERQTLPGFADPYGLGIDPISNEIYIADGKNGLSLGEVVRFSPTGSPIDTFGVGIFPNGFVFR